jgi:hypothetical protein
VRSEHGFSAFEPNVTDAVVGGSIFGELPALFHVTLESRIDHPEGMSRVRLFDWMEKKYQEIGSLPAGPTDAAATIAEVDATHHVRPEDARVEASIRHVVIATFSPLGFIASIDRLEVLAD